MTQATVGMTDAMRRRITEAQMRVGAIGELMSSPDVVTDARRLQSLGREQAALAPIVERGEALIETERQLDDNRLLLDEADTELRALAEEEIRTLDERHSELVAELLELLRPRDPNDERDVIMEIRAGTGGDEAALFAGDLLRMYLRYGETRGRKA